jgi:HK97 family phage prohead protease
MEFIKHVTDTDNFRETASKGDVTEPVVLRKQFNTEVEVQGERSVKFVITTGDADRENDVIDPSGWDLSSYLKNPVVMFAHDYNSLPVARTTELSNENGKLVAVAEFATYDLNPLADQVFQMLKQGFLKGASVGFKPVTFSYNEKRGGVDFAQQELLEFSVVPIPANASALMAAGLDDVDTTLLRDWAEGTLNLLDGLNDNDGEFKGISPTNVSTNTAPMDTPWRRPSLGDFTDEPWGDLTNTKKRRITGHFAWATTRVPDNFGDMKLPHHRPDDGYVVWRGVVAASGRLNQTNVPSEDVAAIKRHLAKHFKEFDREAPWLRDEIGWNAFLKARDRAQSKSIEPLDDMSIARLFDDFGFTEEATALVSDVRDSGEMPEVKSDENIISAINERFNRIEEILNSSTEDNSGHEPSSGGGEMVLEVEDAGDKVSVDTDELAKSIRGFVGESLRSIVASETTKAINTARGRLD